MSHVITANTKEVAITSGNFNLPVNNIINRNGQWYVYRPVAANNALYGAAIEPFRWGSRLELPGANTTMKMNGTIALIDEPWESANVLYHGGVNEWIGAGVNDITDTTEDNAFFFSHLGSTSPATNDDAFYWDRAYLAQGATDWEYYEYHKHLPTTYTRYENGRMTVSGGEYINPTDKSYGYMIHTRVTVSGTPYQSVMARIHTPSVGGAHNSHNDITLPTTANRNYQMGGILKGVGNRFHAFFISADGAQWKLYGRTYVNTSASFTTLIDLGTYDLADPVVSPSDTETGGDCYYYPVRASVGDVLGSRIYFPVIMNNATSGFDLEIWSYTSNDTIAGGSVLRYTLLSGQTVRPDCQLCTVGENMYALAANTSGGGISLFAFDGTTWEEATTKVVTNSASNYLRVHGFRYNTEDVKFYALLSGNTSSTGSYTGPGLYSFQLAGDFLGYKHIDYDSANNAFVNRGPLSNGHIIYSTSDAVMKRSANTEPEGIASGTQIINYSNDVPSFFNESQVSLGGSEFYYQGIKLLDNRKLLGGRVQNLSYSQGSGDLLLSVFGQSREFEYHFAYGGINNFGGDDYITGMKQSTQDPNKVWITGYTKSELIPKRDIKIHGYVRNSSDAPNLIEFNDLVKDNIGDIYLVGTNSDGYAKLTKFDSSYNLVFQKIIGDDDPVTGESIAIDNNNNVYVVGNITSGNVAISKVSSNGTQVWAKTFGESGQTKTCTGVAVVTKDNTEYVVMPIVDGTSTTFVILDTNGNITEQNQVSNLVVRRVRDQQSTSNGRFLFAGTDGSTNGKFGVCEINSATRMVLWTSTFANTATDIANIDGGATPGYVVCGTTGTSGSLLKVTTTESAGVFTTTKSWARALANTVFNALTVSDYTDTTRLIYVVGKTDAGGVAAMGMDEGLIAKYDNSGTQLWENVFGHDMDESINGVISDITGDNIITCGWSESHSSSRDGIVFRCEKGGFGTGVYHLEGNAGVPYYYLKTTLVDSTNSAAITNLTAPTDIGDNVSELPSTLNTNPSGDTIKNYDGSYGRNGTFMLFFGYIELDKIQEYVNTAEYHQNQLDGRIVNYTDSIWKFWQIATVGDGFADDGNVFGYDIIESSDNIVYVIGQTSGDLTKTNTGTSGVYDYVLVRFDPTTEEIEMYQNGTELDEETYALTELSDGTIAFTGRTTGDLGNTNIGSYDIFLGIYNPANDNIRYYSTGTGLDDRGINIHDLGNNELAIVYSSYGAMPGVTNEGSEDVGVIVFNYSSNTWGTSYQTGTSTSDLFEQNGKPSTLLDDGRICIVFSTGGNYSTQDTNQGYLDIALATLDRTTGTFTRGQVGAQTSEVVTSVFGRGERLLITGYITNTFGNEAQGIFLECDVQSGFGGKSSAVT